MSYPGSTDTLAEVDYDDRYDRPLHWVLDPYSRFGIDYTSYTRVALDLVAPPPMRLLDAGCGDGFITARLAQRGHEVTGVDASKSAIAFARAFVSDAEFVNADLRDLDQALDGEDFDGAVLVEVLEHIPVSGQAGVLDAIARRLRPGGELILTVPTTNSPPNPWHYKHFTLSEVELLLARTGFKLREVRFQFRLTPVSRRVFLENRYWRALENRLWDLKVVRRGAARLFETRYERARGESDAARLILLAARA